MKLASVVVEYVLIGFQVMTWLLLLVFLCSGTDWVRLQALREWSTQISILAVGAAYMIGVLFDRMASLLSVRVPAHATYGSSQSSPLYMRMSILVKNPEVYRELEQFGRNTWLLRSTSINSLLIVVSGGLYLIFRRGHSWWFLIPVLAFASLILLIGLVAFRSSAELNFRMIEAAYSATSSTDVSASHAAGQDRD